MRSSARSARSGSVIRPSPCVRPGSDPPSPRRQPRARTSRNTDACSLRVATDHTRRQSTAPARSGHQPQVAAGLLRAPTRARPARGGASMAGPVLEQPHVVLVQEHLSRLCTPRHAGHPVLGHPPLRRTCGKRALMSPRPRLSNQRGGGTSGPGRDAASALRQFRKTRCRWSDRRRRGFATDARNSGTPN